MRGAERRPLAVRPHLGVADPGRTEPVDHELGKPPLRELEGDEVDRVGVALVQAARVARVDGVRDLVEVGQEQVDEVDAALEERPVRHRGAPGNGLVPGSHVHELPELAENEPPHLAGGDRVADRLEDRLLAELVVDGDPQAARLGLGEHVVGLLERLDERLLREDVQAGLERLEQELVVRRGRGRDRQDLRPAALEELVEARVRRVPCLPLPGGPLLRRGVEAADHLDPVEAAERG